MGTTLKLLVVLFLFLSGCVPFVIVQKQFPASVVRECANYCQGPSFVHYRNQFTYFCECPGRPNRWTVMSGLGTTYR